MVCHQCGSPVDGGVSSCPNCGAALSTVRRLDLTQSKGLRISQQLKAIRLEAQHFPPGEEIAGRFVLREMIGKGPFGEVYRATDSAIDADVAVKIFDREVLKNPQHAETFRRVTKAARSMTQPNVVRIHDSGLHKDHPWVSMQLLEGLSLRKVLDLRRSKGETFELDELEPVIAQITLALQHVSRDFPHADLKPENIIFLPDLMKVTDSFIFAALPAETIIPRVKDSAYLAPELHTAKTNPDARADVYSLGTIIGEMLFGPDYAPGSKSDGPLGPIDGLIKRATAFDPNERYPSVEALSEDLTAVIDTGVPMQPTPTPASGPKAGAPPPPPRVPPPPTRPPAATIDPEASKATEEYKRGQNDIENHVLTTEVQRERLPPPPRRIEETAAVRKPSSTASATASIKARSPDPEPGKVIAGILALFAILAIVFYFATRSNEVEEIGQVKPVADHKTEEIAPVPKVDEPPVAPTPADDVVANPALAATAVAAREATKLAEEKGAAEAAREAGEGTPTVAEEKPTADNDTNTNPSVDDTKSTNERPQKKTEEEKDEPKKATGTDCPGGSQLVKSSSGNYCVDVYEFPGGGTTPKTNVSWFQAKKTCESKGKRLCTLSEWKGACGSRYPYGRSFDADKCNTADEDGFDRSLAKTGSFKQCRSRSGAYDMVGNAHEWVAEQRIAGGGFESDEAVGSCRYSSPKSPASTAAYIGFRCCADPE